MTPAARALLGQAGYAIFAPDAQVAAWAEAANCVADTVLADSDMQAKWLQCQDTWFVGVDALPTGPDGAMEGTPLKGAVMDLLAPMPPLHPAQLSVTYPGYPRPRDGESDSAFAYRRNRDAAHVDGILALGAARRRYVREPHAWVLGLPLNRANSGASPLVVWEGSHLYMREAFVAAFAGCDPADMADVDVTDVYTRTRKQVFDTCRRVPLTAEPGCAILLHPLLLHGVAPWETGGWAQGGRRIAYFRPALQGGVEEWLTI